MFPASKPGHAVVHEGHTALFDYATGKINIFESAKLDNRALPHTDGVALPEVHHGVAVQLADGKLMVTDGDSEAVNAVKLLSAHGAERRRTTVAESRHRPGVHGEAVAKNGAMVAGCQDGILVIKGDKISKLDAPDACGRIGKQAGSKASSVVFGDYKKDKDAELERPRTFSLTDTATNTLKLVDIDYSYSFRSLARSAEGDALLPGTDGKLHICDSKSGKEITAIDAVGAWEEPLDWQQPRPTVHVSGKTALVAEPAPSQLHLVDLKKGTAPRSVTLPEVPNEITSIAGQPASAQGREPKTAGRCRSPRSAPARGRIMVSLTCGDQFDAHRRRVGEDVQHRAVLVHGRLQFLIALAGFGALDLHGEADLAKAGADRLRDAEQPAHIEVRIGVDFQRVDLQAQLVRVEAVDHDLAGDQRAQGELDGAGGHVVPGQCLRLVDDEAVLAGGDLAGHRSR